MSRTPDRGLAIGPLEEEARERTGLDDFGGGDWREALTRLIEVANREAQLSNAGRAILRALTIDRLVNRLEVVDWCAAHTEVERQRIEAPIVLATLPRTGQTAAGWILDRDPANRSLLTWFAKRPVPPPAPEDFSSDPRLASERARVRMMPKAVLDMHLYDAEEPDECHWLLSQDMKIPHEIYSMHVPSYYRWVRDEADMRSAYAFYAKQLRMLQVPMPGRRWVLKNSPHLLFLNELHETMPDAIYVQLHRDPLKVLASNCRLAVILRGMQSDHVDPHEIGESMLELLGDYTDRLLAFREAGTSRPWIDLRFRDFVTDPVSSIRHLYREADLELGAGGLGEMRTWVEAHPRNDLARAKPADLAPYGIAPERARERFAAYQQRFAVEEDGI